MRTDGDVIIGIDADTSKFDKKLNELYGKTEKSEKKIQELENKRFTTSKKRDEAQKNIELKKDEEEKINRQLDELDGRIKEAEKVNKRYEELSKIIYNGKPTASEYLEYSSIKPINTDELYTQRDDLIAKSDKAALQVDEATRKYQEQEDAIKKINNKIDEENVKLSQTRSLLSDLQEKQRQYNEEQQKADVSNLKSGIESINKGMANLLKGAGKAVLAIFGIRGAYMAIRQAMSTLSQYDDQLRVNLEYIRFALAMTIKPIIDWIVQQMFKILQYVNYIYHAWTGKNLFANSGIDAFQKKLDKIQKQLYGFDEANVMGDKSEAVPSIDLSKSLPTSDEVPKWVKALGDLANHRKELVDIFATAAAFFVLLKTASVLKALHLIGTSANIVASKSGTIIGLIGAILGFFMLKNDIIDFIESPSWSNFFDILSDIAIIVGSLMIMMGNWNGIIPLVAGAIGKLGIKFLNASDSAKKEYDAEKDLEQAHKDLKDATDNLYDATDKYERALANSEEAHKKLKDAEDETKISGEDLFEKVKNGTLHYKDMTDQQKKVYDAFIDTKNAEEQLSDASDKVKQANQDMEYANLEIQRSNDITAENFDGYKDKVIKAYDDQKISAQQAADLLRLVYDQMDTDAQITFEKNLPNEIKKVWDDNNYSSSMATFKSKWDKFWEGIGKGITSFAKETIRNIKKIFDHDNYDENGDIYIKKGGGTTSNGYGGGGGGFRSAKGSLIKLSSGAALTNNPGHGVPLSNVITGEAGTEGILPLSNINTMSKLGEIIGRYAVVNTENNIYLDSRRIARELSRNQNDNDFITNS